MKPTRLVISCEHASNQVPTEYQHLFDQHQPILETHRALDLGAKEITNHLCNTLGCDCTQAPYTRLVIDCNRSLSNPHCFSEFTKPLSTAEKKKLITRYYLPYRQQTEALIEALITEGNQVLHLSIHTFTPELNGVRRNTSIGLLYDSARHGEREVARLWQGLLENQPPPVFKTRKNYPYRGNSDGFTSHLRKTHTEHNYLGLEVEVNQALLSDKAAFELLINTLSGSLKELLQLL